MTHTERTRFIILTVLLVILVVIGVTVSRLQRQSTVGADVLGVIQNQAAATFKSEDGLEQTTLSDISEVTVSSGVNNLTVNYNLGKRANQNASFDVQFYNSESGQLVTTLFNQNGQNGVIKIKAKNIANGTYDISFKPVGFLSQSKKAVAYTNGTPQTLDFPTVFKWGDIDVSHAGKGDNVINNADWAVLVGSFNESSDKADYNADGVVNNVDASVMLANWGPPGEQFDVNVDATPSAPPEL
jgi:hypothetical protein